MACVAAVAQVRSLAWELPHATGLAKKKWGRWVFHLPDRETEFFEKFLRIVRANKSEMCSAGQQAGNSTRNQCFCLEPEGRLLQISSLNSFFGGPQSFPLRISTD